VDKKHRHTHAEAGATAAATVSASSAPAARQRHHPTNDGGSAAAAAASPPDEDDDDAENEAAEKDILARADKAQRDADRLSQRTALEKEQAALLTNIARLEANNQKTERHHDLARRNAELQAQLAQLEAEDAAADALEEVERQNRELEAKVAAAAARVAARQEAAKSKSNTSKTEHREPSSAFNNATTHREQQQQQAGAVTAVAVSTKALSSAPRVGTTNADEHRKVFNRLVIYSSDTPDKVKLLSLSLSSAFSCCRTARTPELPLIQAQCVRNALTLPLSVFALRIPMCLFELRPTFFFFFSFHLCVHNLTVCVLTTKHIPTCELCLVSSLFLCFKGGLCGDDPHAVV
jgi:hypothetical protein